jgi:hypothetical protein
MEWGSPVFVLGVIAISTAGWLINSWIRARHGYPVEREWGGVDHPGDPQAARQIELLATENESLKGKLARLEERLSVLERIATDPARRIAAEIDGLK